MFGESDLLPGLVLDRFGDVVVGQIATAGMERFKETIEAAVRAVVQPACLFWKNDSAARELEHLPHSAYAAFGEAPQTMSVLESGLSFSAPLAHGQKTGWFYDQTCQPRAAGALPAARRAGAGRVLLCGRLGGHGTAPGCAARLLRRLLAGGARVRRRQRAAQRRAAARRCGRMLSRR